MTHGSSIRENIKNLGNGSMNSRGGHVMDPHSGFQGREGLHSEMKKDRSRTAKTWVERGRAGGVQATETVSGLLKRVGTGDSYRWKESYKEGPTRAIKQEGPSEHQEVQGSWVATRQMTPAGCLTSGSMSCLRLLVSTSNWCLDRPSSTEWPFSFHSFLYTPFLHPLPFLPDELPTYFPISGPANKNRTDYS